MARDLDDLRGRLEGIAEELDDHATEVLRAAADAGATEAPDEEKLLIRARRSVEKAVHLLLEADEHRRAPGA